MDLSVIIIYANEGQELLRECLKSVYSSLGNISTTPLENLALKGEDEGGFSIQHLGPLGTLRLEPLGGLHFEVIVINNSAEKTEGLKKDFVNLVWIENGKNYGVSHTRNQGAKLARGRALIFLDTDQMSLDGAIEKMYTYLIQHSDIGALSPQVVLPDGRVQVTWGELPSLSYLFIETLCLPMRGDFDPRDGFYDFLSGGGTMIKREVWQEVGDYDQKFFYGWEDTDWCKRAGAAGVKLFYFPEAKFLHLLHQGADKIGARQTEFYLSAIYYYRKHYGFFTGSLVWLWILIFSLSRIGLSWFKKQGRGPRGLNWRLVKSIIAQKP